MMAAPKWEAFWNRSGAAPAHPHALLRSRLRLRRGFSDSHRLRRECVGAPEERHPVGLFYQKLVGLRSAARCGDRKSVV